MVGYLSDPMLNEIDKAIEVGRDIISEVQHFRKKMTILRGELVDSS